MTAKKEMAKKVLGLKLREYRERSGLTLSDVAKRLEISYQAVQRWEMGASRPSSDKLSRLAWLYGVSVDEMLKDDVSHRDPLSMTIQARLARELHGLLENSKVRANRIYELAMRDMGVPGVMHSFLDEATELYISGKMSDEGLYVHAKSQVERIAKLLANYDAKKLND